MAATANTVIQTTVPDHLRGRVVSVYLTVFAGSTPIGGPLFGALAVGVRHRHLRRDRRRPLGTRRHRRLRLAPAPGDAAHRAAAAGAARAGVGPARVVSGAGRRRSCNVAVRSAASLSRPAVYDPSVSTPAGTSSRVNRLARETSPYLLQHAHNPVDWYAWGPEALERARREDKPIFLSIGYAACHWCHVMERESFEDDATAADLNARFVAIKVDREERPDLDQIYMSAVVSMTGQGGWPLNVFLTPDAQAVLRRHLLPRHEPPRAAVVPGPARAGSARRGPSAGARWSRPAAQLVDAMTAGRRLPTEAALPGPAVLDEAVRDLETQFDAANGGWGRRPEVPAADGDRVPAAAATSRPATRARSRWRAARSTGWPTAASTTTSAAASRATRPTRTGSCRTSRRCSTTTRSSPARTSTRSRSPATRATSTWRAARSTTCCAR